MQQLITTLTFLFSFCSALAQQWNVNGNYSISGKVGIGTSTPAYKLDITNQAGEPQDLLRVRVNGAPSDFLTVANQTDAGGQFIPGIYGFHSSDNRQALYVLGVVGTTNDSGTEPIMVFDSRLSTAPALNRTLFAWDSYGDRKMVLSASGNLGIGTNEPLSKLHISNGSGGDQLRFTRGTGSVRFAQDMDQDNLYLFNHDASATYMFWKANGYVGIGTQAPDAMLTVKGDIHTREVRVDMNGSVAGDYVFHNDYDLLSLEDLESYIVKNSHLPEVPAASEMESKGLNLKEMNLILLKKVEELTLHIIEINKKVQTLEQGKCPSAE